MNRSLAVFLLAAISLTSAAAERPNVVLILIDDLGRNDLGCYGSTFHKTPNIDRLAREGVKFTDAYSAAPVCSPTRAAIMTGKHPARLNLTDWLPGRPNRPDQRLLQPTIRQQLPLEEITIAEELKQAGYVTGHIGKWHLGREDFGPEKQGFDVNIAGDHTGTPLSYFAPFKNKDGRFMPGLEKAPDGEYLTDRLTAEAEKFIDKNKDRPFFLYLAHYAVHIPMKAKAEFIAKYKSDGAPGKQNNAIYAAMIESVDDSVGRILKKLDDLKLSEKTLVIFTSDNGGLCTLEGPNTPPTINSPFREGKGWLYEGGIRVPLMMRLPGVTKAGTQCSVPVAAMDLFPTILEACDLKPGINTSAPSLLPALKGEPMKHPAIVWHYPHYSNQGGKPSSAIRDGDLKLIYFHETKRAELYDLRLDPGETRNLTDEKRAETQNLQLRLSAWINLSDDEDTELKPNPDYFLNPQAADRVITLSARTADVHGLQLRYEPLPHKNTLGFWTRADDYTSWEFTAKTPGTFTVELLQGCAKGQGGSEVEVSIGDQVLKHTVKDTGGWQAFQALQVGTVKLDKAGRYTLTVKPRKKAGAAVMDLREVVLRPKT